MGLSLAVMLRNSISNGYKLHLHRRLSMEVTVFQGFSPRRFRGENITVFCSLLEYMIHELKIQQFLQVYQTGVVQD